MSQVVDQARGIYDKFTHNGNTTTHTAGNTSYSTTHVQGGQVVGGQSYANQYTNVPNATYGGQTTYSQGPTDYKLVNQTFQTTGGYSRLGQSLTQKVVA